eukprot:gene13608-13733_t
MAVDVVEHAKLVDVQYIIKERQQQQQQVEEDDPFGQHQSSVDLLPQQQHPSHAVLSLRITLHRLSATSSKTAVPAPASQGSPDAAAAVWGPCSGWAALNRASSTGHMCTLEYPLFQLESSDYIVPVELYERGLQAWGSLRKGDRFSMMWDGTCWEGVALGFRQRNVQDPFWRSPWRSIIVDWPDDPVDRATAPEDWCYGNPWEMQRPAGHQAPGTELAAAGNSVGGRRTASITMAPWTIEAAAEAAAAAQQAAAAAAVRANTKRRRHRLDEDYVYEGDDDDAEDDYSDASFFYYDDDPEDFEFESRRQGVQAGPLVTGHTGRTSSSCNRQYHAGCLLLLNAAGIRTVQLCCPGHHCGGCGLNGKHEVKIKLRIEVVELPSDEAEDLSAADVCAQLQAIAAAAPPAVPGAGHVKEELFALPAPSAGCVAGDSPGTLQDVALASPPSTPTTSGLAQPTVACSSASGDVPVTADSLGPQATAVRNFAFASFWLQLPLTAVSAGILIFAISFNKAPGDISRWFALVGIIFAFISTFFAHGFKTLAKQAINDGKQVSRTFLVQNLVRNTNINLAGIGITLIGLQASVGTLVSKTMLAAANAPYAAPAPGGTLISLDVFSLQASTNTLLAHFLSIVFANCIVGAVNNIKGRPAAA